MIIKNALIYVTAEDTIWTNFLYKTLLRACGGSTIELQTIVGGQ